MFVKQDTGDLFIPAVQGPKVSNDLVDLGEGESSSSWKQHKDQPLERCFDFLCDNESYKVSIKQH